MAGVFRQDITAGGREHLITEFLGCVETGQFVVHPHAGLAYVIGVEVFHLKVIDRGAEEMLGFDSLGIGDVLNIV